MEYTSGTSSWGSVVRRLRRGLRPQLGTRSAWSIFVPVVALIAGLLFTTSARTAQGTDLRDDRTPQLTTLINDRTKQIAQSEALALQLRNSVYGQTSKLAGSDSSIAAQQTRGNNEETAAGLVAMSGPAVTVTLNDAPHQPGEPLPRGVTADDIVVHQQDVQAVVNALWSGGAEAMTIMGVRVISTSAVRCVGNTLLLQGRVYSPPFVITAIGDPTAMQAALISSPTVSIYRQNADVWNLGYSVQNEGVVTLPAYTGSTSLQYAQVP